LVPPSHKLCKPGRGRKDLRVEEALSPEVENPDVSTMPTINDCIWSRRRHARGIKLPSTDPREVHKSKPAQLRFVHCAALPQHHHTCTCRVQSTHECNRGGIFRLEQGAEQACPECWSCGAEVLLLLLPRESSKQVKKCNTKTDQVAVARIGVGGEKSAVIDSKSELRAFASRCAMARSLSSF